MIFISLSIVQIIVSCSYQTLHKAKRHKIPEDLRFHMLEKINSRNSKTRYEGGPLEVAQEHAYLSYSSSPTVCSVELQYADGMNIIFALCVISGFRHCVNDVFAFIGSYVK
jgi:hypothetical protein